MRSAVVSAAVSRSSCACGEFVRSRQFPRTIERLLRQRQFSLSAGDPRLTLGDELRAEPGLGTRELSLGYSQIRITLRPLRQQFGIIDADERRTLRHVLGTGHDDLPDSAIDACRHVEGARLHFALDHEGFPAGQVPDRKPDHRDEQHADDQRGRRGETASADVGDRRRRHRCGWRYLRHPSARSEKDVIERSPDSGNTGSDRSDRLVQCLDRLGCRLDLSRFQMRQQVTGARSGDTCRPICATLLGVRQRASREVAKRDRSDRGDDRSARSAIVA